MKTAQINIGGQERTLDFGKMYFSKYFGDATGHDPFDFSWVGVDPVKQFDYISGLVFGGINCYNQVNKIPLVKLEDVKDWVGSMEDIEAAQLILKYQEAIKPKEPGEEKAQLESPLVGMS